MYETNNFRKGLRVMVDDNPFQMIETQFVKPGKGQAFTRVKLKNLILGNVFERTYKSGEKLAPADVQDTEMQFLYKNEDNYHFMDMRTYEQMEMSQTQLGDTWKWIVEEMTVNVVLYEGAPISVTLPNFSVMEITYCEPGIKGDTATGATKPASVATGATLQVPLFVVQGEKIKIDTRTNAYVERVKD